MSWEPQGGSSATLFDTHAHYDDERFDVDRDALLASLPDRGVVRVLNVSSDVEGSYKSADLAAKYGYIYGAAGVHPLNADEVDGDFAEEIERILARPKMVAVGEIGLDYHYDGASPAKQKAVFESQLDLAKKLKAPVVIHSRDAEDDTLGILRERAKELAGGVFHCFAGPLSLLEAALEMGFYVAYGGACTFKKTQNIYEAIMATPIDRLLIETDCPYLAPEPFRGKRNDSSLMRYVAERVADAKGMEALELARATAKNACDLFGIKI